MDYARKHIRMRICFDLIYFLRIEIFILDGNILFLFFKKKNKCLCHKCHICMGILNDLDSNFGIKFVLFCDLCIYFSDYARFWLVRVLIANLCVSSQGLGEKYEV